MRFLCFHRTAEDHGEPKPELFAEMSRLIEDMTKAGVLVSTGGLRKSADGSRIRLQGGKITVTDGPFTESKELVAGFAIVDVRNRAEAVEWATRFGRIVGDCEVEVRQMYEGP